MWLNFFIWCSGASRELLKKSPETDRNRQIMIGVFVFLTAVSAFLTSSFALYTVFRRVDATLLAGSLWASIILNLDRFLVSTSTLKNKEGEYKLLVRSLVPRVLLAAMIGMLIGTPFELYIFKDEIRYRIAQMIETEKNNIESDYQQNHAVLLKQKHAEQNHIAATAYDSQVNVLMFERQNESNRLEKELTFLGERLARLEEELSLEVNGKGGSGRPGCGRICRDIKSRIQENSEQYRRINLALTSWKGETTRYIQSINEKRYEVLNGLEGKQNEELKKLEEEKFERQKRVESNYPESLLTRYKALEEIQQNDLHVFYASLFITLFFVFIEIAPILAKAIAGASVHDLFIHQERLAIEIQTKEKEYQLTSQLAQEKLKQDTEQTKLENESTTYQTAYQSFLGRFRQAVEKQTEKLFEEWGARLNIEVFIQQMDIYFREHFEQILNNLKEFSRTKQNSAPPSPLSSSPLPESQGPEGLESRMKLKAWAQLRDSSLKASIGVFNIIVNSTSLSLLIYSGSVVSVISWFREYGIALIPFLMLVFVLPRLMKEPEAAKENWSQWNSTGIGD